MTHWTNLDHSVINSMTDDDLCREWDMTHNPLFLYLVVEKAWRKSVVVMQDVQSEHTKTLRNIQALYVMNLSVLLLLVVAIIAHRLV